MNISMERSKNVRTLLRTNEHRFGTKPCRSSQAGFLIRAFRRFDLI